MSESTELINFKFVISQNRRIYKKFESKRLLFLDRCISVEYNFFFQCNFTVLGNFTIKPEIIKQKPILKAVCMLLIAKNHSLGK